ncbi:NosD domain-containing protein [Methanolobus sp. ZRKC3]|uniref:NosD domain-containing protein n=1 Tax=Methanolobus sp. ZRKC3 TaxID=3125786 RepID=UPI0032446378
MRQIKLSILRYQIIAMILLLSFSCIATVSAAEVTVGSAGEDYSSISAALANAADGDTIIVSDGTYNENIVVDREVTIRSQSGAVSTIVNSSSDSDAFDITASNVIINGFTVTGASASSMVGIYLNSTSNCTVSNNIVTGNYCGIDLDSSSNNTLSNNNASLNDNYGISLDSSSNNSLANNTANGNYYGINFYYSSNNEITNNNASNNENHGIYLSNSNNNELVNNHAVVNDYYGIFLTSSSSNNLTGNNASGNNCGIRFSSSDNNYLTGNNASNNDYGIRFFSSSGNNMTANMMSSNTYNFNVNVYNSNLDDLFNDIDDSNKVDGKSIYYWTNRTDEEVPSDAGIVYVVNSTNITVKDTEVTNEYSGINFAYTTNSTIENVTTSECNYGIYLYHSNVNELTNNSASYNDHGIYFSSSSNNNLTSNHASGNECGISLSSSSGNELTSNNANNNNEYGIYLRSSDYNDLTSNNANDNNEKDLYVYSSASCTVDRLVLTDNLAQLSFVTDSSSTSIIGYETNAYALSGKTNVNGYASIDRSSDLDVNFFYDDSGMSSSGESSVTLYRLDGSIWVEVPDASLNTSGNYLSASLSEFGTFGLFKGPEQSSDSGSSSGGSSTYARTIAQGTITDMTLDDEGELTKDSTAISSNGMAKLEFSKGTKALDPNGNPVSKVIIITPASLPSDTPKEVVDSGLYYDFGPSGTTFSQNVLITIDFDSGDLEGRTPVIYTHTSEDGWVALETIVDWQNGRATSYISHFSLYALFSTDAENAVEEASQVIAESSVTVEKEETPLEEVPVEDGSSSSFIYWISGIGIVLSLGIVIIRKQKGERGL